MDLSRGYVVLPKFDPGPNLDETTLGWTVHYHMYSRISGDFQPLEDLLGIIGMRPPGSHLNQFVVMSKDPINQTIMQWHKDLFTPDGCPFSRTDAWLGVWSNLYSTRLRDNLTGEQILVPQGCPILFDNERFDHKAPPLTQDECLSRYFVRVFYMRVKTM